ncbi:MAG: hypothetical protein HQK49_20800 [Oligoflexia bacterium]|nr:hypothetical protein [Oligoflexia bacterium]
MFFSLEIILAIVLFVFLKAFLLSKRVYRMVFCFAGVLFTIGAFYGILAGVSFWAIQWFFNIPIIVFSLLLLILKMRDSIALNSDKKDNKMNAMIRFGADAFTLDQLNVIGIDKSGEKIPAYWRDHKNTSLAFSAMVVMLFFFINSQLLYKFYHGKSVFSSEMILLTLVAYAPFAVGLFGFITHKSLLMNALFAVLMYNGALLNFCVQVYINSGIAETAAIANRDTFILMGIIVSIVMTLINFSFLMNYFDLKKNLFIDDASNFKN